MIFKSEKMSYDEKDNVYKPMWELDTIERKVTYRENGKEKITEFHTDYIKDHLRYVMSYRPERLQEYVDSGEIIKYLDNVETQAIEAVDRQVERWKAHDRDYLLAVQSGDFIKQAQLENNLEYRAKEIIYQTIINA